MCFRGQFSMPYTVFELLTTEIDRTCRNQVPESFLGKGDSLTESVQNFDTKRFKVS